MPMQPKCPLIRFGDTDSLSIDVWTSSGVKWRGELRGGRPHAEHESSRPFGRPFRKPGSCDLRPLEVDFGPYGPSRFPGDIDSMITEMKSSARRLLRIHREPRKAHQTRLLMGRPDPDPRLPKPSLDPNARFIA